MVHHLGYEAIQKRHAETKEKRCPVARTGDRLPHSVPFLKFKQGSK